jgi:hypothetical protein
MRSRLLLLSTLLVGAAVPAAAQLPCPAGDPCFINSTVTIPVGVYDIRPRSLVVGNRTITVSGAGELKILAANVTIQPGGRFVATGTDGNTTVTLDATGTIDLQSQGTSKSRIDVSGNFGGGTINLLAVGNVTVNGTLVANATNLAGFGGPITLRSETGSITVTGDPSEGIKSFGNAQGGGGAITMDALLGSIAVSTQLVAKGGDCGSCEVSLTAGGNVTTTAQGLIDLRASGIGDGGYLSVSAGGDVNLAGNILANGSSDEMEGGAGGDILISAIGSITVGGRIELNGAGQDAVSSNGISVDGDGGSLDVSASGNIQMNGPMFGLSKGFGQGDEFSFDALGNVTLAAEIDLASHNFGGDVTVLSDSGIVTVSARVRTTSIIDALHPSALGGTIDLEGCQVNITSTGQLIATGPGGNPSGANFLVASTGLTVAGTLTATSLNELTWRTTDPVITGTVVPDAMIVNDPTLPCCDVQCPTTTTSTSTTSTTTQTPTTVPTTTTTTTGALSTTTSSTAAPSTTSSLAPTTTSSTGPTPSTTPTTTTTTSSTAAPTTTTTTTAAPSTTTATSSTSTSSTATTPPTTSTTVPPATCFDTAVGLDAVRCRLDAMSMLIGQSSETDLGGRKLARVLARAVGKATTLTADPASTKRLKKAAKQLRLVSTKLARALARGKVDAALASELTDLASEAQAELAGLTSTG